MTPRGLVLGTPAYTAPEVLRGDPPSVIADVYGLAATLFTALSGRPAYGRRKGEELVAQLLRITTERLPDLAFDRGTKFTINDAKKVGYKWHVKVEVTGWRK